MFRFVFFFFIKFLCFLVKKLFELFMDGVVKEFFCLFFDEVFEDEFVDDEEIEESLFFVNLFFIDVNIVLLIIGIKLYLEFFLFVF